VEERASGVAMGPDHVVARAACTGCMHGTHRRARAAAGTTQAERGLHAEEHAQNERDAGEHVRRATADHRAPAWIHARIVATSAGVRQPLAGGVFGQPSGIRLVWSTIRFPSILRAR